MLDHVVVGPDEVADHLLRPGHYTSVRHLIATDTSNILSTFLGELLCWMQKFPLTGTCTSLSDELTDNSSSLSDVPPDGKEVYVVVG